MTATKSTLRLWLQVEDPTSGSDPGTDTGTIIGKTSATYTPFLGGRRFEIGHYSSSFSINSIPRARVKLAIGRDAADGETESATHTYHTLLQKMSRVRVMFRGDGDYSPGVAWPDKDVVIFEGRILSPGLENSTSSGHFTLDLIHWLHDLDSSSMFGRDSHVGNPITYVFRGFSSGRPPGSGTGIGYKPGSFSTLTDYNILAKDGNVVEDLWGRVIKPVFSSMASRKILKIEPRLTSCFGELERENVQAQEALSRMEGESEADPTAQDLPRSSYTPPLSLFTPDGFSPENMARVKDSIVYMLANQSLESMCQNTFWGKLVGQYAPSLSFAVVPQAERALVVPFAIGLRDTYAKRIRSYDYTFINKSDLRFRPLRAVAVLSIKSGMSGALPPQVGDVGACFQPSDGDVEDGQVRVVSPPEWLMNVPVVSTRTLRSSGLEEEENTNTSTTPQMMVSNLSEITAPVDTMSAIEDYYRRYARWVFVNESLRGRTAQISGKLRFDIAPGSSISLETVTERHLQSEESPGTFITTTPPIEGNPLNFVATVSSVTVTIDSEKNSATTGFVLMGVRTMAENASDKTSLDQHPLYGESFIGAPLVPDLAFYNEYTL